MCSLIQSLHDAPISGLATILFAITCVECVLLACVHETADAVVSTDEAWCIECQYIPSCKHIFPTIFDKISSNIIIFAVLIECVLLYIYQNIK